MHPADADLGLLPLYGPGPRALFQAVLGLRDGPAALAADPLLREDLDALENRRAVLAREPIAELGDDLFRSFRRTGDRSRYEAAYFSRRERLLVFALSLFLRPGAETSALLEDTIRAICDERTWALPAHIDYGEPEYLQALTIDLFAAETALALCECLQLCAGSIGIAAADRATEEVRRRVLRRYQDAEKPFLWERMDNNWCAVCAGAIGATAVYLLDDGMELRRCLRRLLPVLQRYLDSFPEDGVCLEGLSYWTYGMSFYTLFAQLLKCRSGGRLDLLDNPKIASVALFQQRAYMSGDYTVSFSDADRRDKFRLGTTMALAHHVPALTIPPLERRMRLLDDRCFRFSPALRDLFAGPIPQDRVRPWSGVFHAPQAQWLLHRRGAHALAVKGGHNGEPHNHNDVGSFIWYAADTLALTDLGAGLYTREYFGEGRYGIFCNASRSHSVPEIAGLGQSAGTDRCASLFGASDDGRVVELEFAGAYDVEGLDQLRRRIIFDPDSGTLQIEDFFAFRGEPLPVLERFVTTLPVELTGPAEARLDLGNGGYCRMWFPESGTLSLIDQTHLDHGGKKELVGLIEYEPLHQGPGELRCTIRCVVDRGTPGGSAAPCGP